MTDPADSTLPDSPTEVDPNEAASAPHEPPEGEVSAAVEASGGDAAHENAEPQETRAEGDPATAEGASEGEGQGKKKRRRRRRKKKKGAEGEAAAQQGAAPAAQGEEQASKKKEAPPAPFQKLFDGTARRHAFSVGEIVAGRVSETGDEVAVIDLFGKAIAFARRFEPREIPVVPIEAEGVESDESAEKATDLDAEAASSGATQNADAGSVEHVPDEQAVSRDEAVVEAPSAEQQIEAASEAAPSTVEPAVEPTTEAQPAAASAEVAEASPASDAVETRDSEAPPAAAGEPPPEPAYRVVPEGVVPLEQGSIFRGRVGAVAESGHIAIVNELVDVKATRAYLRHARDARLRVPGLVFGFNRGGFDVLVYGLRAFCPVSGMTLDHVEDPTPLLGQWAQFHVQAAKSGVQGLVVSRRSILEKEARKRAKALLKSLTPGQTVRGRVTQVREYGLFVDIGGIEGLLHQSELSWERGVRPEDVAKVGDEIEVQVLKVHERESKRERHDRVSLSMKALQPDPWKIEVDQLVEGQPRKGTVVRTAEFGAFVQLAPGVDGLLHISELGRDLKHADQAVQVGDEIYVVVERIDRKQRRISLSKLSAEEAEAFEKGELAADSAAPRIKPGAGIKVRVTQVAPGGLHVQVDNVIGKRGRGFIPNAEMGTPRGTDHRREWPPGTEIDVVVIGTDRDGGLRCSRKRFLQDEERRAVREYRKEVSKQGLGTFGDILRQKLGMDHEGPQ